MKYLSNGATRIGFRTAPSTLDLLIVPEDLDAISDLAVVDIPFSDHSLVKSKIAVDTHPVARPLYESRNLQGINLESFRSSIASRPLMEVRNFQEVNMMWQHWHHEFMDVLEEHAPLRVRRQRKKPSVPWMNATLLHLIARRKLLHRAYIRQNRDQEAYSRFKEARTTAHAYNRKLKNDYFCQQCTVYHNDSRRLWNIMNSVTGRVKKKVSPGCTVNSLGQTFHDNLL